MLDVKSPESHVRTYFEYQAEEPFISRPGKGRGYSRDARVGHATPGRSKTGPTPINHKSLISYSI